MMLKADLKKKSRETDLPTMALTIADLREGALEQLEVADRHGLIPREIKYHQSTSSLKRWSHVGEETLEDHGNFSGSLAMLLLLLFSALELIAVVLPCL